jgi:hypothetical protein
MTLITSPLLANYFERVIAYFGSNKKVPLCVRSRVGEQLLADPENVAGTKGEHQVAAA